MRVVTDEFLDNLQPRDTGEAWRAMRLVAITAKDRFPMDAAVTAALTIASRAPLGSDEAKLDGAIVSPAIHESVARVYLLELVTTVLGLEEGYEPGATELVDALEVMAQDVSTKPRPAWREWTVPRLQRMATIYADLLRGQSYQAPKPWSPDAWH